MPATLLQDAVRRSFVTVEEHGEFYRREYKRFHKMQRHPSDRELISFLVKLGKAREPYETRLLEQLQKGQAS